MASQDGSSKEYAPGVNFGGDNDYVGASRYYGKAPALIASGLLKPEWLPGEAGNGKTAQSVVFHADGTAALLPARARLKSFDAGYGALSIQKSGRIFHVWRYWTKEEIARKATEKQESQARETWLAAKEAANQNNFSRRWKDGVLHHICQAERLIEGKIVFTDFPDVGMAESDIESAKRIIAELKNLLSWATPTIRKKVQIRSNVFSLNEAAFRNMRKH